MVLRSWSEKPRVRRGVAIGLVALAVSGLILARSKGPSVAVATHDTFQDIAAPKTDTVSSGSNVARFSSPGLSGRLSFSHTHVIEGRDTPVYATFDVRADSQGQRVRAPLAVAVVLDTSGSMSGQKIGDAKRSIARMVSDLRDDDEISLVRYSDTAEVLQNLAPLGNVRRSVLNRVSSLEASGGTNIPAGLTRGLETLAEARKGRVRRLLLASDGLDENRWKSKKIAEDSSARGVTVSSLGIGLDFDEGYMGGLAEAGHGNFAFVNNADAFESFLHREIVETASTTAESVRADLRLPSGVRFVRAHGANVKDTGNGSLIVDVGSLFAGDERRVVIELAARLSPSEVVRIDGNAHWNAVGGPAQSAAISGVALASTQDEARVREGRDGAVLADATSVLASTRQIEAAEAYRNGDAQRAQALIAMNTSALAIAAEAAPPAAKPRLASQAAAYTKTSGDFANASPMSESGRATAKAAAERDFRNMSRSAY